MIVCVWYLLCESVFVLVNMMFDGTHSGPYALCFDLSSTYFDLWSRPLSSDDVIWGQGRLCGVSAHTPACQIRTTAWLSFTVAVLSDEKHKDQFHFRSIEQSRQRAIGDTNTQVSD